MQKCRQSLNSRDASGTLTRAALERGRAGSPNLPSYYRQFRPSPATFPRGYCVNERERDCEKKEKEKRTPTKVRESGETPTANRAPSAQSTSWQWRGTAAVLQFRPAPAPQHAVTIEPEIRRLKTVSRIEALPRPTSGLQPRNSRVKGTENDFYTSNRAKSAVELTYDRRNRTSVPGKRWPESKYRSRVLIEPEEKQVDLTALWSASHSDLRNKAECGRRYRSSIRIMVRPETVTRLQRPVRANSSDGISTSTASAASRKASRAAKNMSAVGVRSATASTSSPSSEKSSSSSSSQRTIVKEQFR